jgi:hypothetical protein
MPISASAGALLAELEPLPSGERFGAAIRHALALAPAERDRLLSGLAGHGTYGRELAAAVAAATGAGPHVAVALDDPSPRVRGRVLRAALATPGLVDPATLVAAVTDGPRDLRLAVYRGLRRLARPAVPADELIGPVRERWGDAEAARLLPACATATVRALLPELAYAVSNWSVVARPHPAVVREYVAAELAAAGVTRPRWWARNPGPVTALARYAPGDLLDLCERWLTGRLPHGVVANLGRILAHDTGRTVRLLLVDPDRARQVADMTLSRRVVARFMALPDAEIGALLHVTRRSRRFEARVLGGAAPSRREALFDAANAGRDLTAELVSDPVLTVLPHARRHAEARRMLALPTVRHNQGRVIQFSAYLPYAQARAALVPLTGGTDADERAAAYGALIRAAAGSRDRASVTDLFSHLGRVRNERDPVRMPVLRALASVRTDLFDPADPAVREGLDQLVRDAIDARDQSYGTREAVQRLVFGVLTEAATQPATGPATGRPVAAPLLTWAFDAVERLTVLSYAATAISDWRQLRRGREHEVFARIRPWLVAAVERGQPAAALGVARALGRRAWHLPDLQALVEAATRAADDGVIRQAVGLWLEPPSTRTARAAALVGRDESYVTLRPVLDTLARRRTDLVDALILAGRPLRGRFGTAGARWIPDIDGRVVAGWTPARIRRYADLLRLGVDDGDLQVWSRASLARLLAALAGPAAVTDLLASPEVPVAEGALGGLGACEAPLEALPVLLDHAGGDRARVAIFAAGRCVRRIRPRDLTVALTAALHARRITVRKEAVRLLALARPPGAVDALLAAWQRADLHRDVRIALVTALREWPADPRAWAVLDGAAAHGERGLALSLASVGAQSLPVVYRHRFAAVVRGLARHPDPRVVRAAHTALRDWAPYDPGCVDDLAAAVTDLTPGREWSNAVWSLSVVEVWGQAPGVLSRTTAALVRLSTTDDDAQPTRDLPARQRLRRLVELLVGNAGALRRHRGEAQSTIGALRADPSFTPEAATLAAALAWPGPALAGDLATVADLLAGLPATTTAVIAGIPLHQWPGLDADSLDNAASTLARRTDVPAGLLAVALVATVGAEAGWPAPWREHLRALRRHPGAEVRHAALRPVTYKE